MTLPMTTRRFAKAFALVAGLTALSLNASAALYASAPPAGSTFVRLFNSGSQEVAGTVGTAKFSNLSGQAVSAFSFMPKGDYKANIGTQTLPVSLASDTRYTIVANGSTAPQLVKEPDLKDKQKSMVVVQNLTDKALSVKTADGKTEVVPAVAAKGTGMREINPVKIKLSLFDGANKVADLPEVTTARGEQSTVYITGNAGALKPVWLKSPQAAD